MLVLGIGKTRDSRRFCLCGKWEEMTAESERQQLKVASAINRMLSTLRLVIKKLTSR